MIKNYFISYVQTLDEQNFFHNSIIALDHNITADDILEFEQDGKTTVLYFKVID